MFEVQSHFCRRDRQVRRSTATLQYILFYLTTLFAGFRCTQHTLNGCQSGTNTQLQSFVYSNSVDVNPNRKRKQEDDCWPTPANKVSSVGKTGLANPFGGSKRCVCGLCHAQVKSVTSYFLHWVREHREVNLQNFRMCIGHLQLF